jgi:hypothetical protein
LYEVNSDPYEQHEVSAANPDVLGAMQKEMAVVLESYSQYSPDKSCPPQHFENNSVVGKTWQPWC